MNAIQRAVAVPANEVVVDHAGSTGGVNPAYHPYYFGNPPNYACFERFKSYDAASGTYLGNDGRRHPCKG